MALGSSPTRSFVPGKAVTMMLYRLILYSALAILLGAQQLPVSSTIAKAEMLLRAGDFRGAEALLANLLPRLSSDDVNNTEHLVAVQHGLGRAALTAGHFSEAVTVLQKALAAAEATANGHDMRIADIRVTLGEALFRMGRYPEADREFRSAIALARPAQFSGNRTAAQAIQNLAQIAELRGNFAEAESLCRQSLTLYRQAVDVAGEDMAPVRITLARLYLQRSMPREAKSEIAVVLEESSMLTNRQLMVRAAGVNVLGSVHEADGEFARAEEAYAESLRIRKTLFGNDHPDTADSLGSLGWVLAIQGTD